MCSIMGYCSPEADLKIFKKGFDRTKSRGPDDSRIIDTGKGLLGFHRLSIMGLTPSGMQPFERDGSYVVCNGELYGFEKERELLKDKGYSFQSDSDCEIILPMYFEYGTDMFARLDAEFACIIYDGKTGEFIAARDPIGIRPLYYGYDKGGSIIFASEAKNLVGLAEKIMPFPPGHYYKNGEFICYCDIAKTETVCHDDVETACAVIRDKLVTGVKKRLVSDAKVGFLLSGGLDSSLVCAIAARESDKPIETFAIGMSEDAIDLKYAKQVADYIGSHHTEIYMTPDEVISSLEELIELLGTYDITTVRASMGMYLLCKAIHKKTDIRVLLTGEISDELFGYKDTDYAPNAEEFHNETVRKIGKLHLYDCLRANKSLAAWGVEGRVPFLDKEFLDVAMTLNPAYKMCPGKEIEKKIVRDAFSDMLPDAVAWRQKEQFSDGVGYSWIDTLKKITSEAVSDEEMKHAAERFPINPPRNKEEYYYRSIFEKHFPSESAARSVPSVPSVACSTAEALAWDASFRNVNEPSGRAVKDIHEG